MDNVVICKRNNPNKIIEKNDVHYFYWPKEFGSGKIKFGSRTIPSFVKHDDYEPIKITMFDGKMVAMTRFHYDTFIYFNNLVINKDGKPIADFYVGSHTPFISVNKNSIFSGKKNLIYGRENQITEFSYALLFYKGIFKHKLKNFSCEVKEYELSDGEIPNNLIFDPSTMSTYVVIGRTSYR